ncbi:hypothetical protein V6Z12_D10G184100 [Gossypium hirsutum]
MFSKLKIDDNMFKELTSDIKSIICLYEASHWGMDLEHILDKALAFATLHLESLVVSQSCPNHLRELIGNALKFPYHKGMQRVEARHCISYYKE